MILIATLVHELLYYSHFVPRSVMSFNEVELSSFKVVQQSHGKRKFLLTMRMLSIVESTLVFECTRAISMLYLFMLIII